jgi:Ca-activated chloride channel family protein
MRGSMAFLWAIALASSFVLNGCDDQAKVETKTTITTTTTVVAGDATKSAPPGPPAVLAASPKSEPSNEAYAKIVDNPFQKPAEHPLSTFAIDVDTASYSNVRRFLTQGMLRRPTQFESKK